MGATRIEALVFDLGDVIVLKNLDEVKRAFVVSNPERERLPWGEPHWLEQVEYERGRLTTEQFIEHVRKRVGRRIESAAFIEVWRPIFHLNEPLAQLIPELAEKYPLVLLSNIGEIHWKACESQFGELFRYFKKLLLSFETGLLKPDGAAFRLAALATERPIENCAVIDDSEQNVEAARTAGLQAFLYTGKETVQRLATLILPGVPGL
jgi:putative hydrolase of the HAD superfamily